PPPRNVWTRVAALTGAACLLGAVGAYGVSHRSEARCAQEAEKLAAAWGPTQREQVRAAFLASGAPYASVAWGKVAAMLDAHASQWRTLRTEACMAASENPTSAAWQTSACLDTRLWQLASVTDVLRKADAQTVRNAQQLASSLEGLEGCRNAPALTTRPQPPDALRPRVDAVRRKLADADAQRATRRYSDSLRLTSTLLEEIKDLDFKPLEAEVLLTHGYSQALQGNPKEAEPLLYKALWTAEAGRDDETAARAWNLLLWVVGDELARPADAERIAHHARAAVARLGRERFPDITADLHYRLGMVLMVQGKYQEADTEVSQGLELVRRVHGEESLHTGDFLHALGRVRVRQRRYGDALALHQQALALRERLLGGEHPELLPILNSVAMDHERLGHTDEAIAALRRAIAIHERSGGEENVFLASPLRNLAIWLRAQGKLDEAWAHQQRVLAIFERIRGPDHPDTALTVSALARLAGDAERIDEALSLFEDSLARLHRSLGPDSPRGVTPLFYRAELLVRLGRYAEAKRDAELARALQEKAHGPNSANAAMVFVPLAGALMGSGAPREALALCERGRALNEAAQGPESMDAARNVVCIAEAHLALGEPDKALPLAERARERLGSSGSDRWDAGRATFVLARAL
ncbi:tetratricopeptide repeat protein, partial [Pyxidicoccus sp. 3LFB2]